MTKNQTDSAKSSPKGPDNGNKTSNDKAWKWYQISTKDNVMVKIKSEYFLQNLQFEIGD